MERLKLLTFAKLFEERITEVQHHVSTYESHEQVVSFVQTSFQKLLRY